MGAVPEQVRTWPGARRSAHPQTSFAALGPRADEVVAVHDLDCQLGERSPLAALERLDAEILLLGADFGTCTALHLAEYRVPGAAPTVEHGAAVLDADGGRRWVSFRDLDLDEGDFGRIGEEMGWAEVVPIRVGPVGAATARLLPLAPAVAWAAAWMSANRPAAAP
jgi:aminoglycoside 3-N-acetyltransferase